MLDQDVWETEEFLKENGACLHYGKADLEADRQTLQRLVSRP